MKLIFFTVKQKIENLDAAHLEELRILTDEQDGQLKSLRDQLNAQLDAMSAEIKNIQNNHEAKLLEEKVRLSVTDHRMHIFIRFLKYHRFFQLCPFILSSEP